MTVGLVAVVGALLVGCSAGDGRDDSPSSGVTTAEQVSGPLGSLQDDDLCPMVDHATIEEQFGESVENELGGKEPLDSRESISCTYVMKSLMEADGTAEIAAALSIGTRIRPADDDATTAEEALDGYFVNWDDEVVAYERIDGLGDAAGYAGSDLEVRLGGNHLVAIVTSGDGTLIEVITKSEPAGTMDQLRPIADEVVEGVEGALR